ncbi:MAG: PspC domain-containing protein [Pseudomonadaceae bacterium]|nr:PspC domain-containing protein [Pseudomonadaceae bacterium]
MSDRRKRRNSQDASDFQAAANRLEEAVSELMTSATGRVTDGATRLLDDAASAIRSEVNNERQGATGSGRSSQAEFDGISPKGDRLQRDSVNGKLAGVCAGIARYYGVEAWMVRCLTITLFLFMPTIVFPAYWIAYFVLGSDATGGSSSRRRRHRPSRRGRRRRNRADRAESSEEVRRTPAEELRSARSVFEQLEMRLRRMESHVTSGRYDLQRELRKIEPQPGASS